MELLNDAICNGLVQALAIFPRLWLQMVRRRVNDVFGVRVDFLTPGMVAFACSTAFSMRRRGSCIAGRLVGRNVMGLFRRNVRRNAVRRHSVMRVRRCCLTARLSVSRKVAEEFHAVLHGADHLDGFISAFAPIFIVIGAAERLQKHLELG